MRSDSFATMQTLERRLGCANLDALSYQRVGHAVVVTVKLDVVVDVDADVTTTGAASITLNATATQVDLGADSSVISDQGTITLTGNTNVLQATGGLVQTGGDGTIDVTSIYEKGKLVRREITDPSLVPL